MTCLASGHIGKHLFAWIMCLGTVLVLIVVRPRIRRRLKEIGKAAAKSNATEFRPTLSALLMTAGLATTAPVFMWFFGWRLNSMQFTNTILRAFGTSLQLISVLYFSIEFFRRVFRPNGLAVSHSATFTSAPSMPESYRVLSRISDTAVAD